MKLPLGQEFFLSGCKNPVDKISDYCSIKAKCKSVKQIVFDDLIQGLSQLDPLKVHSPHLKPF